MMGELRAFVYGRVLGPISGRKCGSCGGSAGVHALRKINEISERRLAWKGLRRPVMRLLPGTGLHWKTRLPVALYYSGVLRTLEASLQAPSSAL